MNIHHRLKEQLFLRTEVAHDEISSVTSQGKQWRTFDINHALWELKLKI